MANKLPSKVGRRRTREPLFGDCGLIVGWYEPHFNKLHKSRKLLDIGEFVTTE